MTVSLTAKRSAMLALTVALVGQTVCSLGANAQAPQTCVRTLAPVQAAAPAVVPVETIIDRDVVYTNVNDEVQTHLPPLPSFQAPLDTLKLQVANRMNSGLITGQLSDVEADEITAMLDRVKRQEDDFKVGGHLLTQGAVNNLMRKYHMIDHRLSELLENGDFVAYMPSFELRRAGLMRRIQYNLAAGNLTPGEAEQLLAALDNVSDNYAADQATGGTLSATELESLHRDLSLVYSKLVERVGGTIAFTAPATHDKLAELNTTIQTAIASRRFSDAERKHLLDQYGRLVVLQDSIIADEGPTAGDIQILAKEIDNMNFILTRELRDRQLAAARQINRL